MGAGIAGQCSENRCLARWTVWIPHWWPRRRSRLSELEERPGQGLDPRFVPYTFTDAKLTASRATFRDVVG
jgi:hypothetical protein